MLQGLPPYEISEIGYKNMLQNGKRPQIYRKVIPQVLLHSCSPIESHAVTMPIAQVAPS